MNKSLLRLTLLVALLAFGLSFAHRADAQIKSVVVARRDADITLLSSGDANVIETWQVQFSGGPFHTAFRAFDMRRMEGLTDVSVSEGDQTYAPTLSGTPGTFAVSQTSQQLTVEWFFAPTSDSTRTFTLQYMLRGVVRVYPGGDQFWLKFIEADRAYTINAAHIVEHLPASFSANQVKLVTYFSNGQAALDGDGRTVMFDGGPFPPQAEWEIRTQFPHGIVTAPAPSWQAAADREDAAAAQLQLIQFGQLAGGVIVLIGGLLATLFFYYTRVRQMPVPAPVAYLTEPPDALAPGLAGALLHKGARIQDITATLVDLARRGFLKMSAQDGDYTFERIKGANAQTLLPFEKQLLDAFFRERKKRRLADSSDRAAFVMMQPKIKSALNGELVSQRYFSKRPSGLNSRWSRLRRNLVGFSGLFLFVVIFNFGQFLALVRILISLLSPAWLTLFDVFALVVVAVAFFLVTSRKPITTARGAQAAAKWNAFKRYLGNISLYTQVVEAKAQFEKYLPYAIAFGVGESWVKAFATVDTPAPRWYRWEADDPIERERERASERATESDSPVSASDLRAPSLNEMADASFRGLDSMSASFFGMLNRTASVLTASLESSSPSRARDRASSSDHDWSSSDHDSSSSNDSGSWSGGNSSGGGGSGGGSSGFG